MFGRGTKCVEIGKIRLPLASVLNAYDLPEKRPGVSSSEDDHQARSCSPVNSEDLH